MTKSPIGETTAVSFSVPGAQQPQARPRVTRNGTYNPRNEWRESIQWIASQHFKGWPLDARYRLDIAMYGCSRRGDIDNLQKAVMDALTHHAWNDDRRVDDVRVRRIPFKGEPHTSITVSVIQ